jgi:lysocardiolipin and lysophospholipid acyltransferase
MPVTHLQGRPPKSVNMYWRRFAVSDIPLDDAKDFDLWLQKIWQEKDTLMEQYVSTGRFPASNYLQDNGKDWEGNPLMGTTGGFIETQVKTAHWWEVSKIFMVLGAWGLVANILVKIWNVAFYGNMRG